MSHRVAIVDTNVPVAGLLTRNPDSPVARVLDGMLSAAFTFVLSEALLAEYRNGLVRPALREQHGLTAEEVDSLLTEIAQHAIVLGPVVGAPAPDPGDQMLWDLLATRADLVLVTGDQTLLADAAMRLRTLSPREFMDG